MWEQSIIIYKINRRRVLCSHQQWEKKIKRILRPLRLNVDHKIKAIISHMMKHILWLTFEIKHRSVVKHPHYNMDVWAVRGCTLTGQTNIHYKFTLKNEMITPVYSQYVPTMSWQTWAVLRSWCLVYWSPIRRGRHSILRRCKNWFKGVNFW